MLIIHLKGVDCDLCISGFAASRGCECMAEPDCDVTAIIPQGCISCGNKAMEYCDKQTGSIMIYSRMVLTILKIQRREIV